MHLIILFMTKNIFILFSLLSITFIYCSTVCPIKYKCLNETDPLCFKETTKDSVIIREERKCPKGQYCKKKSETEVNILQMKEIFSLERPVYQITNALLTNVVIPPVQV